MPAPGYFICIKNRLPYGVFPQGSRFLLVLSAIYKRYGNNTRDFFQSQQFAFVGFLEAEIVDEFNACAAIHHRGKAIAHLALGKRFFYQIGCIGSIGLDNQQIGLISNIICNRWRSEDRNLHLQ